MTDDFYMTSIKAKGNKAFWKFSKEIEDWRVPDSHFFWESKHMAWECQKKTTKGKARKRNMVYKNTKRRLNDLWWDIYEATGIKLNGIHLGFLFKQMEDKK